MGEIGFEPVRGVGVTLGFDFNTKTDVAYNSKKHMVVLDPTLMVDVPGFLNVSLLALWESNQPSGKAFPPPTFAPIDYSVNRYSDDTHAMLTAAWGIPMGKDTGLSFEGFANFIAAKGKNEFGGDKGGVALIATGQHGAVSYTMVRRSEGDSS